jgi:hypothetical protein
MVRWLRLNALSLAMFGAFVVFLTLQSIAGWHTHNEDLADFGQAPIPDWSYLGNGHFISATFENWKSEFLQMASYVLFTVFLVQKGSPESHPIEDEASPASPLDDPRAVGQVQRDSPWPAKRGGLALKAYESSLTTVLFLLFAMSFLLHLFGGTANYNEEQALRGEPTVSVGQFLFTSDFWYQSMQNWQSEFLAVGALIVLSIFLRQRGSSQSKPVAAPHAETGS